MRVVCDTNILARSYPATLGLARRLLDTLRDGPDTLLVSPEILSELRRVLGYSRLR